MHEHVNNYIDHYDCMLHILDILNCMISDHNCSQICMELEGSFNCSCYLGYQLQEDGATCIGTYNKIRT